MQSVTKCASTASSVRGTLTMGSLHDQTHGFPRTKAPQRHSRFFACVHHAFAAPVSLGRGRLGAANASSAHAGQRLLNAAVESPGHGRKPGRAEG